MKRAVANGSYAPGDARVASRVTRGDDGEIGERATRMTRLHEWRRAQEPLELTYAALLRRVAMNQRLVFRVQIVLFVERVFEFLGRGPATHQLYLELIYRVLDSKVRLQIESIRFWKFSFQMLLNIFYFFQRLSKV